jgi:hypothetical protein
MRAVALVLAALVSASVSSAAETKASLVIDKVELKAETGEWVNVVEPDKPVDPSAPLLEAKFFNNADRIPAGKYVNVRLTLSRADQGIAHAWCKNDFHVPVSVHKGSFVRVAYTPDHIAVTVDEDVRLFDKALDLTIDNPEIL